MIARLLLLLPLDEASLRTPTTSRLRPLSVHGSIREVGRGVRDEGRGTTSDLWSRAEGEKIGREGESGTEGETGEDLRTSTIKSVSSLVARSFTLATGLTQS